jgi:hypothetical protein
MASRTVVHVLPYGIGLWQIKFEHEPSYHSVYGTKYVAVETARGLARRHCPSRLLVHKEDSTTEFEYAYNGEPSLPES